MQTPCLNFVSKETWDTEYRVVRAIPSSSRDEPAKALVLFADLLRLSNLQVLDLGAGNGRNAVYLAERGCRVTATDFSDEAVAAARRRVSEKALQDLVTVRQTDVTADLCFPAAHFDLVLDAYTSCHILDDQVLHDFWRSIEPLVKLTGHVLSISFSTEDTYYSRFRSGAEKIVTDTTNGVTKRLYDEPELKALLSSFFAVKYFCKFEFGDVVHGTEYRRAVFIAVLQRNRRPV